MIATTPKPPYYAVIFTSIKKSDDKDYAEMAEKMQNLVQKQQGFLGMESAKNETGITISYWKNLESIKLWKDNAEHLVAQKFGKEFWYENYKVRVCLVKRDYEF
ncbi:MAG: antibiotic biosynthesis monooxygenase [Flavobacteriaceae bacterium]|jgi:heme-degrading monooxygenase HmoA|nr:antibiotic biosynthesis monooxygenase [Flavobacteriaceae bacterium]